MSKDTINAIYTVKNEGRDIKALAQNIAIGQSTGAWNELPANVRLKISNHLAEIVSIEKYDFTSTIKIAFPIANFRSDLGALLTAVYGKISLAPKIKLEDLELTEPYYKLFKGPKVGIQNIRKKLGKDKKPLLMSIFKPCPGMSPEDIGEMFSTQTKAGIDLVKDDEILYDHDFTVTLKRLETCLKIKEKNKAKTIYAINLTGSVPKILNRAKELEQSGAECILFNYIAYGLPLLQALREELSIPIMAHPACAGALCLSTNTGLSEVLLLGKLPRLAGADFVLFPSPYGSIAWDKEITKNIQTELTKDIKDILPAWPVPSAGIKPSLVKQIVEDFGEDIVINAGTGVWAHKDGGLAGAKDFIKEVESLSLAVK